MSKAVSDEKTAVKGHECVLDSDSVGDIQVGKGPLRPFLVTEPPKDLKSIRTMTSSKERLVVVALGVIAAVVRLWNLSDPSSVVFDEVHFGKFAAKYIKGIFFTDVHPPLAKMLFAGVGSIAGFTGDFEFKEIGLAFPESTPYYAMRLFSASLGLATVFLMYFTLRASGIRVWIAFVAALMFALENSFVTISRYILLDAPLIFFIAASAYSYKKYEIYATESFTSYKALLATGLSLGLAVSSKWVGLFTLGWIGVLSILKLWFDIGDLKKPISSTLRHTVIKAVLLLAAPAALYLFFFYIHFQSLVNNSDGAGFFSSAFRSTLNGNTIPSNILADVGVGSSVSIRHTGTMGGYLHSHSHVYETGSKQQQITLYSHLDANNDWIIELYEQPNFVPETFEGLKDGTKIRLRHRLTNRRLHSHDHKPPVSESSDWQKEVSAYGADDFDGDANDDWVIEIDIDASTPGEAQEYVKALDTKFRLRHAMTGCMLFSHEAKLPKWGYEQQEVTCASSGIPELTLWYIENNENPTLPEDAPRVSYKTPTFLEKFIESHQRMWHINKNLKDHHVFQSDPATWPFLLRGISYWSQNHKQIYLLGNAVVWWSVTALVGIFVLVVAGELLAWQLGKPILQDKDVLNFHIQTFHYLLGWALHYVPSFLMGRQLFLHHYLPAYYFGILALAHLLEITVSYVFRNRKTIGYGVVLTFLAAATAFFVTYKPLIYGSPWTKDICLKSQKLGNNWDYGCFNFLDNLEDYDKLATKSSLDAAEPSKTAVADADSDPTSDPFAGPPAEHVKYDVDEILNDNQPKRFVDENGVELSEEQFKAILEQGGRIQSVEKEIV
ncbi:unnamed protein product [Kluyveromyces dobzhanskii CBS 2104]|uniref:Dolichyl-phosphate-mannose--protein mannosyltransferase n=1 Tax=Kluyveromyces dobzhanskii CBS 2104 TaxID=1427455 RepID=A0A0A8L7D6_9SACH|nr:unnamed protein product [Kluyveromyces dobzhanskii CBS 2104]